MSDFDQIAESIGPLGYRCLRCGEPLALVHDGPGTNIHQNGESTVMPMEIWACRACDLGDTALTEEDK